MSKVNLLLWEILVPSSDSSPVLTVDGGTVTAEPRRNPSPSLAYDGQTMTATPRR